MYTLASQRQIVLTLLPLFDIRIRSTRTIAIAREFKKADRVRCVLKEKDLQVLCWFAMRSAAGAAAACEEIESVCLIAPLSRWPL